jgi:hypothetical protein
MSNSHSLKAREKAFEDMFFQKRNEELIEAMRARKTREEQFAALGSVLGTDSKALIEPLLDLGLRGENVTALVLAPLVAVAWADRTLDNEERRVILKAEDDFDIDPESEAGQLLANWLDHRPHESLLDAWAAYVGELCGVLGSEERARLRDDIVSRAHRIARAVEKSFLRGGGPTDEEKAVVARVEAAFDD